MKTFNLMGHTFRAAALVDGVLIDPELPAGFDDTANEERDPAHRVFEDLPFIRRTESLEPGFLQAWPAGVRFDVRCLDGGAWDRSTVWGMFGTLSAAVECARAGRRVTRDELCEKTLAYLSADVRDALIADGLVSVPAGSEDAAQAVRQNVDGVVEKTIRERLGAYAPQALEVMGR